MSDFGKQSAPWRLGLRGLAVLMAAGTLCQPMLVRAEGAGTSDVQGEMQQQQQILVEGTVTGADGEPLIGVTVMVKGGNRGTATDVEGHYQIKVDNPRKAVLEFTYIGMKPQEIKVDGRKRIDVKPILS